MNKQIPRHGCARCIWWQHKRKSENGKCRLHAENRYYRFPPCDEYELDPMAPDTIDVGDEIHDDY